MATVKRANVAPTHPTVYGGLALAVVGLLVAMFAYTGSRVYDIMYALIALVGGLLALGGILTAAWGRSIMSARASRTRRAAFTADAMTLGKPEPTGDDAPASSETSPTIASPAEKRKFAFGVPKREKKEKAEQPADGAALFAFKRRGPDARAQPEARQDTRPLGRDDPRSPASVATLTADPVAMTVRVTLRCPKCENRFTAEGVRPFEARCDSCGFSSTV